MEKPLKCLVFSDQFNPISKSSDCGGWNQQVFGIRATDSYFHYHLLSKKMSENSKKMAFIQPTVQNPDIQFLSCDKDEV